RLAHRVAVDRRLRRKQSTRCWIRDARHGIDDLLAIEVNSDLEAALGPRLDHVMDGSLDLHLEVANRCLAHVPKDHSAATNSSLAARKKPGHNGARPFCLQLLGTTRPRSISESSCRRRGLR